VAFFVGGDQIVIARQVSLSQWTSSRLGARLTVTKAEKSRFRDISAKIRDSYVLIECRFQLCNFFARTSNARWSRLDEVVVARLYTYGNLKRSTRQDTEKCDCGP
jgi:hypothetical protein